MSTQNPVFIPGPTNIPDSLRRALDHPTIDHRSQAFAAILEPTLEGVKRVVQTDSAEVMIFPSTGTGAWEAAVTNTLSPGDRILAARHGMFTHRWIDLCQRHGFDVEVVDLPWGEGAPAERFETILKNDSCHAFKAVLVCHNETTTGVKSDVAAVRRVLDATNHPAMLFVDGVSSIASMEFRMDDWGVDIAITGSQKGFMLPAGLAILCVSPKALEAAGKAKSGCCFFDFSEMLKSNEAGGFPYTPPVDLLRGLAASITILEQEGLSRVYDRHDRIAQGIRKAIEAWGLKPCPKDPSLYSSTVTAVVVPQGFDGTAVVNLAAEKYGVAFGVGLGQVAGKVFRIGHLGSMTDVMAIAGIATAEMVMSDLGFPITLGSGVRAAQDFYRRSASAENVSSVCVAA